VAVTPVVVPVVPVIVPVVLILIVVDEITIRELVMEMVESIPPARKIRQLGRTARPVAQTGMMTADAEAGRVRSPAGPGPVIAAPRPMADRRKISPVTARGRKIPMIPAGT
jgi:hypothetical protein